MPVKKKVPEVIIKDQVKPLEVTLEASKKRAPIIKKSERKTLAPNTTEEEDRSTLGQRNINLIWETTQSRIALISVYVGIGINTIIPVCMLFITGEVEVARIAIVGSCLNTISTTVGIIIGFYFSRTNHSTIGGTGKKPQSSDSGTR